MGEPLGRLVLVLSNQRKAEVLHLNQQPHPSFSAQTAMKLRVTLADIGANLIDGPTPYAILLRAGNTDVVGFEPNRQARWKSWTPSRGQTKHTCRTLHIYQAASHRRR